jgi:tetratricopeptide (TPR) repeat protein
MDEPSTCVLLRAALTRSGNFRQAAQLLERAVTFAPKDFVIRLTLAQTCVNARFPDRALEILRKLRDEHDPALTVQDEVELAQTEAWALLGRSELPAAEKVLTNLQEKYPSLNGPIHSLVHIYITVGRFTNAVALLEKQIALQPNNLVAAANLAPLKMQKGDLNAALPLLDRVPRSATPQRVRADEPRHRPPHSGPARRSRARLRIRRTKHDPPCPAVYYGLAEIAFQRQQKSRALEYYEKYLQVAPGFTPRPNTCVTASRLSRAARTDDPPLLRVTHVITRLILGGAQENTIASVLGCMHGLTPPPPRLRSLRRLRRHARVRRGERPRPLDPGSGSGAPDPSVEGRAGLAETHHPFPRGAAGRGPHPQRQGGNPGATRGSSRARAPHCPHDPRTVLRRIPGDTRESRVRRGGAGRPHE